MEEKAQICVSGQAERIAENSERFIEQVLIIRLTNQWFASKSLYRKTSTPAGEAKHIEHAIATFLSGETKDEYNIKTCQLSVLCAKSSIISRPSKVCGRWSTLKDNASFELPYLGFSTCPLPRGARRPTE